MGLRHGVFPRAAFIHESDSFIVGSTLRLAYVRGGSGLPCAYSHHVLMFTLFYYAAVVAISGLLAAVADTSATAAYWAKVAIGL